MMTLSTVLLLATAISPAACQRSKPIATIDEAEAIAKANDIVLSQKRGNEGTPWATAGYDYRCGEIDILIQQFETPEDAKKWRRQETSLPYTGAVIVLRGSIGIMFTNGEMAERRRLAERLR